MVRHLWLTMFYSVLLVYSYLCSVELFTYLCSVELFTCPCYCGI